MVHKEREKKGKLAKGRWETKQDSTCGFSVTELTNVPIITFLAITLYLTSLCLYIFGSPAWDSKGAA